MGGLALGQGRGSAGQWDACALTFMTTQFEQGFQPVFCLHMPAKHLYYCHDSYCPSRPLCVLRADLVGDVRERSRLASARAALLAHRDPLLPEMVAMVGGPCFVLFLFFMLFLPFFMRYLSFFVPFLWE